jgi:hypothetical protein
VVIVIFNSLEDVSRLTLKNTFTSKQVNQLFFKDFSYFELVFFLCLIRSKINSLE